MFNVVGYIVRESSFHVCGYDRGRVLVQTAPAGKMKPYKLYEDCGGVFFRYQANKYYLNVAA